MGLSDFLYTLSSGHVSAWFLEEDGGDASDVVNGNDLSESNSNNIPATPTMENLGSGRVFGGNSARQGLIISDDNQSGLGGEDLVEGLTIVAWVNHNAFGDDRVIVAKGNVSALDEYDLHWDLSDNRWVFQVRDTGGSNNFVKSDTFHNVRGSAQSGVWYMVVGWWDAIANTINVEIDASGIDSESFNDSIQNGTRDFQIGAFQPNSEVGIFDGTITYVGVWNRALTANERLALYNNGVGWQIPLTSFTNFGNQGLGGYALSQSSITVSGSIGGWALSTAGIGNRNHQFFGGYLKGLPPKTKIGQFGGYAFAQPLTDAPTSYIGGIGSGLLEPHPQYFGGWTFGRPSDTQFVEQHSRTLVKVRSEDVVDQALDLDSQVVLFQRSNEDFNAQMIIFDVANNAEFNARLNIEATQILPSAVFTVTTQTGGDGAVRIDVSGSGIATEPDSFFTSAHIDFGEPYGFGGQFGGGGVPNPQIDGSISGFNFNWLQSNNDNIASYHIFPYPGKYIITASFIDNTGQIHMQGFAVNTIVSGSIEGIERTPIEGIDYPAIEISGQPREGLVPPTILVDFDLNASGTGPHVDTVVTKLNKVVPITDKFLHWNFGNGNISNIKQPFSNYPNPGRYIPVARYQFIHPSGTLISASGGPPGGSGSIYASKPIWISDSLVIGWNR